VLSALPAAPTSGVTLVGPLHANSPHLNMVRPGGEIRAVQQFLGDTRTGFFKGHGATAGFASGMPLPTAIGTATATTLSSTNAHTRRRRIDYLITAAVGAIAGYRVVDTPFTVGGVVAGQGGFYVKYVWGPSTGVSNTAIRGLVGLSATTTAPTSVNPSTLANQIGMGCDSGDTNWQLMYGGATLTKIDLGASFPRSSADRTDLYEVELYSPPGTTQRLDYRIVNMASGAVASGTLSTGLPAVATSLCFRGYLDSGATSSVVGLALSSLYFEVEGL
jgi:hypothetical protein